MEGELGRFTGTRLVDVRHPEVTEKETHVLPVTAHPQRLDHRVFMCH